MITMAMIAWVASVVLAAQEWVVVAIVVAVVTSTMKQTEVSILVFEMPTSHLIKSLKSKVLNSVCPMNWVELHKKGDMIKNKNSNRYYRQL